MKQNKVEKKKISELINYLTAPIKSRFKYIETQIKLNKPIN